MIRSISMRDWRSSLIGIGSKRGARTAFPTEDFFPIIGRDPAGSCSSHIRLTRRVVVQKESIRTALTTMSTSFRLIVFTGIALITSGHLHADLVLETETAQLGKQGDMLFSTALQAEWAKDGSRKFFTLNQYEYALADRAEILIEPFFYEWDSPKGGARYSGVGDLEITPSYQVVSEETFTPAILLAFKLKVPTATNRDIGSGKFDYQPYFILGKTYGDWVFNANIGYDFVTSSKTEKLRDQVILDFSVERKLTADLSVYAEVFSNSSPIRGEKGTFAEAMAFEYKFNKNFNIFTSIGYDSDHVKNIRSGFNIEF
jgi:hypothetical protein